jgi:hypothetical protein
MYTWIAKDESMLEERNFCLSEEDVAPLNLVNF